MGLCIAARSLEPHHAQHCHLFIMSYVCTVNLHKHTAGHIQALQVDHVETEFCILSKEQALCIERGQRLELQLQAVTPLPHGHLMCLEHYFLNGLVSCRILCSKL